MIRIRVSALIVRQNPEPEILLIRHRRRGRSYSVLPGGKPEPTETLEEAFVREVSEETGFEALMEGLVFLADVIDPHHSTHTVNLIFKAEIVGGRFRGTPESSSPIESQDEAYFVPLSSLNSEPLYPAIGPAILEAQALGFATYARYLGNAWKSFDEVPTSD